MSLPGFSSRVAVSGIAALFAVACAVACASSLTVAAARTTSPPGRSHLAPGDTGWQAAGVVDTIGDAPTEGWDDDDRWRRFRTDLTLEGNDLWKSGSQLPPQRRRRLVLTLPGDSTPCRLRC